MRVLFFALAAAVIAPADDRTVITNFNGWYMYFGDHAFGDSKWGVHLEGQWRRNDVVTKWQQLLLRPAINYDVNKNLMLSAGYAFINSYPYGEYPTARARNPEHRIWQQANIKYKTGMASWSTRLRFENRFIGVLAPNSRSVDHYRYENRFRAWQRVAVPLSTKFYAALYDEFWVYVPPYVSNSWFDQNRAYAALGYKITPNWELEAGYMHQLILQRNGRIFESNHTLTVALFSRQPFRK